MGESPDVRYRVCLMASTCGSAAACCRNACTEVENESYGWCSRMSRSRILANMSAGVALSTSASWRGVEATNRGNCRAGAVQVRDEVEAGRVQRRGQLVDLVLGDVELADEQVADARADAVGDLEAHRRAEAAAQQLLLHGLEEVLGVVLLDLDVLVAGHPERVVLLDDHAGEQLLEVLGDDVLDGHERHRALLRRRRLHVRGARPARRVDRDEPGQQRRHLDAGEVLLAGRGVGHHDGEVERQPRDVRERVRRVDRERGEHREDLPAEELAQPVLLALAQLVPADQRDALVRQRRLHLLGEHRRVAGRELVRLLADRLQDLPRGQPRRGRDRDAGGDAALEAGHPDHEELVEVGREDRQEPHPLQQRDVLVLGQLEHALVEGEPGELAVEEPVRRAAARGRRCAPSRSALGHVLGDVPRPGPGRGRWRPSCAHRDTRR